MLDKLKEFASLMRQEGELPAPVMPYKVTEIPNSSDSPYWAKISSHLLDLLGEMGEEVHNPGKRTVERLQKAIAQYPDQPQFYNHLAIVYRSTKRREKALETNRKAYEKFPGYLFARMSMAEEALDREDHEQARQYLGETLRLEDLYPERKIFHNTEVISYYMVAGIYHVSQNDFDKAEEAIRILSKVNEDSPAVEALEMIILSKRMLRGQEHMAHMSRNEILLPNRDFHYQNQTETPPAFHHAEMDWLYEHGAAIPEDKLRQILELPRQTLIKDLETVLEDAVRRFEYWASIDWEENTHSFPRHAIILLGELRATESLPVVLDQLRLGYEYQEYWYTDWIDDVFQTPLYHLGREQLERIQDFVQEPHIEFLYKTQAAKVVELVGLLEPERRGEVAKWYQAVLQYFLDLAGDETLLDTNFLALLIGDITKIGLPELKPLAKQIYDREMATYSIQGEWEDVEKYFDQPTDPEHELNWYYGDAFKQYEALKQALENIAKRKHERQMAEEKRQQAAAKALQPRQPTAPLRAEKIGRNDRVSVKYLDGTVKKDVKYKSVEGDVAAGKAILL